MLKGSKNSKSRERKNRRVQIVVPLSGKDDSFEKSPNTPTTTEPTSTTDMTPNTPTSTEESPPPEKKKLTARQLMLKPKKKKKKPKPRKLSYIRPSGRYSEVNIMAKNILLAADRQPPKVEEKNSQLEDLNLPYGRRDSLFWEQDKLPGVDTVLSEDMINWENTLALIQKKKKPMRKQVSPELLNVPFELCDAQHIVLKPPKKNLYQQAVSDWPYEIPVRKTKKSGKHNKKSGRTKSPAVSSKTSRVTKKDLVTERKSSTGSAKFLMSPRKSMSITAKSVETTRKSSVSSEEVSVSVKKIPTASGKRVASRRRSVAVWTSPSTELRGLRSRERSFSSTRRTAKLIQRRPESKLDLSSMWQSYISSCEMARSRRQIKVPAEWASPISKMFRLSRKKRLAIIRKMDFTARKIRNMFLSKYEDSMFGGTSEKKIPSQPKKVTISDTESDDVTERYYKMVGMNSRRLQQSSVPKLRMPFRTRGSALNESLPTWRHSIFPKHPANRSVLISAGIMQILREKRTLSRIRIANEMDDARRLGKKYIPREVKPITITKKQKSKLRLPKAWDFNLRPKSRQSLLTTRPLYSSSILDEERTLSKDLHFSFLLDGERLERSSSSSLRGSETEEQLSIITPASSGTQQHLSQLSISEIQEMPAIEMASRGLLRTKPVQKPLQKNKSKTRPMRKVITPQAVTYSTVITTQAEMNKIANLGLAARKRYVPEHMRKKRAPPAPPKVVPVQIIKPARRSSDSLQGSMIRGSRAQNSLPRESIVRDSISRGSIARESIPRGSTLRGSIPRGSKPRGSIPQGSIIQGIIPRQCIIRRSISRESIMRGSILRNSITSGSIISGSSSSSTQIERSESELDESSSGLFDSYMSADYPIKEPSSVDYRVRTSRLSSNIAPGDVTILHRNLTYRRTVSNLAIDSSSYPSLSNISVEMATHPLQTLGTPFTITEPSEESTASQQRSSTSEHKSLTLGPDDQLSVNIVGEQASVMKQSIGSAPEVASVRRLSWDTSPNYFAKFRHSIVTEKTDEIAEEDSNIIPAGWFNLEAAEKAASLMTRPPWRNARYTARKRRANKNIEDGIKESLASKLHERRISCVLIALPAMVPQNPETLIPPKRRPIPEWKKGERQYQRSKSLVHSFTHKARARRTTKRGLQNKIVALRRSQTRGSNDKYSSLTITSSWQKSGRRNAICVHRGSKTLRHSLLFGQRGRMGSLDNDSPTGAEQRPLLNKQFLFGKKIGIGTHGTVRIGENMFKEKPVALKMEYIRSHKFHLRHEYSIYKIIGRTCGFPEIFAYEELVKKKYNVLAMELLGPSLHDLYLKMTKFSLKTVLQVINQVLRRIESIHKKGIVHRDITPQNFLVGQLGTRRERIIYMVDFGLSKVYLYGARKHIPYRSCGGICATAKFASINSQLGREQSRRDDLEACGYMFIFFARGFLPWEKLDIDNPKQKFQKICEMKQTTSAEKLCEGLPVEFTLYMQYVRRLKFAEDPDYGLLRNMFSELYYRREYFNRTHFDWTDLLTREPVFHKYKPLRSPNRPRQSLVPFYV